MGAVGGDRQLGRHAGVADGVGAGHGAEAKPGGDLRRRADLLVELHAVAAADEVDLRRLASEPGRKPVGVMRRHGDDDVGVVMRGGGAGEGGADALHRRSDRGRVLAAERELGGVVSAGAIDGETRTVRPAIGQGREHRRGQPAELGLKRGVLQEEADNAAHDGACSLVRRPTSCTGSHDARQSGETRFPVRK